MSKSMRFLGASIFLKGNWPSEVDFLSLRKGGPRRVSAQNAAAAPSEGT